MMRRYFNLLASLALILIGTSMVLSGLHVFPYSQDEASAATPGKIARAAAQVVGYGTDKDTYARGDRANGFIDLKNTGNAAINDITISAKVSRSVPLLGSLSLGNKDFKISGMDIQPGRTRRATFTVDIPKEFSGISTAGDYDLGGIVYVNGLQAGSFSKHIKVV